MRATAGKPILTSCCCCFCCCSRLASLSSAAPPLLSFPRSDGNAQRSQIWFHPFFLLSLTIRQKIHFLVLFFCMLVSCVLLIGLMASGAADDDFLTQTLQTMCALDLTEALSARLQERINRAFSSHLSTFSHLRTS